MTATFHGERAARALRRALVVLRHDCSGQALAELVIVIPLMIIIALFAHWIWEIVQLKLKVQEATRYAAWESTAFRLHHYGKPDGDVALRFEQMRWTVTGETMLRYANMDSSIFGLHTRGLLAEWTPPRVYIPESCGSIIGQIANAFGSEICGNDREELMYGDAQANMVLRFAEFGFGILRALTFTHANPVAWSLIGGTSPDTVIGGFGGAFQAYGPAQWGFNPNGYIHAGVLVRVRNSWGNVHVFGRPLFDGTILTLAEHHGVLADHWNLFDGRAVYGHGEHERLRDLGERRRELYGEPTKGEKKEDAEKGFFGRVGDVLSIPGDVLGWAGSEVQQVTDSAAIDSLGDSSRPAYWDQLNRLYFGNQVARGIMKGYLGVFQALMGAATLGLSAFTSAAADLYPQDFTMPSLVSIPFVQDPDGTGAWGGLARQSLTGFWNREERKYMQAGEEVEDDKEDEGKEDTKKKDAEKPGMFRQGAMAYPTAPFLPVHQRTFKQRGRFFMGCPASQQRGCTDSLSLPDPTANVRDYQNSGL